MQTLHAPRSTLPPVNPGAKPFHAPRSTLHDKRGFTLIEMLVALSLFVTVITIAVTSFITALRSQRQLAALLAANNNMSLTLEQMAREIRTGYNFCRQGYDGCFQGIDPTPSGCGSGGPSTIPATLTSNELHFVNAETEVIRYYLDLAGETMMRSVASSRTGPETIEAVTSDNVRVRFLEFTVWGGASFDCWPPRVTIVVGVSSNDPTFQDVITYLQTTITARQIDS